MPLQCIPCPPAGALQSQLSIDHFILQVKHVDGPRTGNSGLETAVCPICTRPQQLEHQKKAWILIGNAQLTKEYPRQFAVSDPGKGTDTISCFIRGTSNIKKLAKGLTLEEFVRFPDTKAAPISIRRTAVSQSDKFTRRRKLRFPLVESWRKVGQKRANICRKMPFGQLRN